MKTSLVLGLIILSQVSNADQLSCNPKKMKEYWVHTTCPRVLGSAELRKFYHFERVFKGQFGAFSDALCTCTADLYDWSKIVVDDRTFVGSGKMPLTTAEINNHCRYGESENPKTPDHGGKADTTKAAISIGMDECMGKKK